MHWIHAVALSALSGLGSVGGVGAASLPPVAEDVPAPRRESVGRLPIVFEENLGQAPERYAYVARPSGYQALIAPDEAVLLLPEGDRRRVLRMRFRGATKTASAAGVEPLAGRSNYLRGNEPSEWITGARHFGAVLARGVAAGVDVRWRTERGRLRYDLELAPGVDATSVSLEFEGAERLHVDGAGALVVATEGGTLRHSRPVAYQPSASGRDPVDARFVLRRSDTIGFALGTHDSSRPVVIDPTIDYATYVGGSGFDILTDIAIDASGNAYVVGQTSSTDYPTQSPFQGTIQGFQAAFVSKLDPTGSSLIYSTYVGGTGSSNRGQAVAVDATGGAVMVGFTNSDDFPLRNALQGTRTGTLDGFVLKLAASGATLDFSTFLGGGITSLNGVALDPQGAVYTAGSNSFGGFPVQSALQAQPGGGSDAVVAKIAPDGSALVYATYLGGASSDNAAAIAVDDTGAAYVAGGTGSSDFPTQSPFQATGAGGDAFVSKIDAAGAALVYSTYLGGGSSDSAGDIAVDGTGAACVVGQTRSADFPTQNPTQAALIGGTDGFVTRFAPSGAALTFSTYLGRSGNTSSARAVAVGPDGNCHVAWETTEPPPPMQEGGPSDAVVEVFGGSGGSLESVDIGGSGSEFAFGIAVGGDGTRFVGGTTDSSDFMATGSAFQQTQPGSRSGYVVRIGPIGAALGDGLLYASKCTATVNWAKHGKSKPSDALVLRGCMNPRGALGDLSGASVTITLNGIDVVSDLALDRRGSGKSARGQSPSVRFSFKGKNGRISLSLRKGDLRNALGLVDETATGTTGMEIGVTIENAGLASESVLGILRGAFASRAGKTSKAKFKFAADASLDGVFKSIRTRVDERTEGQRANVRAAIEAPNVEALEPLDGLTITIGNAAPLVVPQASLSVSGTGAEARISYRRSLGQVAGLRSLRLDNRRGLLTIVTDELAIGLPAAGAGADTSANLTIVVEMELASGDVRFATTLEMLRPRDTSKNWAR